MAIYTCTMNLAIDLVIETDQLVNGKVNRSNSSDIQANGKGVNVSIIFQKLGLNSHALGFSAGFTGDYIADQLIEVGIAQSFIQVPGITRINVFTTVNQTGQEFKLVNPGPTVPLAAQEKLLEQVSKLSKGDYLIVSGSLPSGVSETILEAIAHICATRQVHLVYDVSHPMVLNCLSYRPYLIKPNDEELAEWFGVERIDEEQLTAYMRKLQAAGSQRVLLSLGEKGALYLDENGSIYRSNAPKGKVVNTACSGDTLLATFLAGLIKGEDLFNVLSKSVAAGSSTAFTSGLTDFKDVMDLQKQIIVTKEEKQ